MTELGDLGIGLELDLGGLDAQLAQLEAYQGKPLTLPVLIDERSLKQQLKLIQLEPLELEVGFNSDQLKEQLNELKLSVSGIEFDIDTEKGELALKRVRSHLQGIHDDFDGLTDSAKDFSKQTQIVEQDLQIITSKKRSVVFGVEADTRTIKRDLELLELPTKQVAVELDPDLEAFKRKLERLERNSVAIDLEINPDGIKEQFKAIKPDAIDIELTPDRPKFQRNLKALQDDIRAFQIPVELVYEKRSGFFRQPKITQSVEIDQKELESSIQSSIQSGFSKVRISEGGLFQTLLSPLTNVFEGFFQGIGEKLGRNVGEGIEKAFQKRSKTSFSQIGEKTGQYIFVRGAQIGDAVSRRVGYAGGLKDVAKDLEYVGKAVDTVLDPRKFGKKYQKFEDNFVSTLEQIFVYKNPDAAAAQLEKTIQPFLDFSRQQTLRLGGVALRGAAQPFRIRKRVQLAASADEAAEQSEGVEVDKNDEIRKAKSISLVTGGIDFQKGGVNTEFAENLVKRVLPGSYSVPVTNPYSNETDNLGALFEFRSQIGQVLGMSKEDASKPMPLDRLMQVAIEKGFNPDSIKMAATAMAYRKEYPDKPINMLGTSGGSYVVEEAVSILERAGLKDIKGAGITAPFAGLTQTANPKNFQANVGELDPLYVAMFGGKFIKAPEDNPILQQTLKALPVRLPGLLSPSKLNAVVEGAGAGHALLPFLAEPAFQKNLAGFLGNTIDPISPEYTGQTGIANLDYQRVRNDERQSITRTFGAAFQDPATVSQIRENGATGAKGYAFINPDEPGWRRDNDFRASMAAPKKKARRTTGSAKEESDDYLNFLDEMNLGLVEYYESGGVVKQKLAAVLARAKKLYPELAGLQQRVLGQVSEQARLIEVEQSPTDTRTPRQRQRDQARLARLNRQFPDPQALLNPPVAAEPVVQVVPSAVADVKTKDATPKAATVPAEPESDALARLQQLQDFKVESRPSTLQERLQTEYSAVGLREVGQRLKLTPKQYRAPKQELIQTIGQQDNAQVEAVLTQLGDSAKLKQFRNGATRSLPKLAYEDGIKGYLEEANTIIREGLQQVDRLQGQQRTELVQELERRAQAYIASLNKILAEYEVSAETRRSFNGSRSNLEGLRGTLAAKLNPLPPPEPPTPPVQPLKQAEPIDEVDLARVASGRQRQRQSGLAQSASNAPQTGLARLGTAIAIRSGLVKDSKDLQVYVAEVSTFFKELPQGTNLIKGAFQRYRANYVQAAERVRVNGEALAASGSIPKLAEGKEQITLVSGGFATKQGRHAEENVVPYFKETGTLANHDLKPFRNSGSDVDYDLFKQPARYLVNAGPGRLARQLIRGYNPDSEALATQAYAHQLVNPGTPVNLFGVSGGAPVVSDAQQILKRLGVKVKAAGVGGASSGVVNGRQQEQGDFRNFLSVFDPVSILSLVGRDKNATFVNDGGYGHFTGSYFRDSSKFKKGLTDFYGTAASRKAGKSDKATPTNDASQTIDVVPLARIDTSRVVGAVQGFFGKQKLNTQKTYEAIVQEVAKLSNFTLKPGDIPKLTVADSKLKEVGATALYQIKENQILITQEVADLLGGTIADIEKAQAQIADVVHEARHGLQLDFGRIKLSDIRDGAEAGVALNEDVSPESRDNAEASVAAVQAQSNGQLTEQETQTIRRLEGDAYEFEQQTPSIIQSVSAQLQAPGLQLPTPTTAAGAKPATGSFVAGLKNKPAEYLQSADQGLKQTGIDVYGIFKKISGLTFTDIDQGLFSLDNVMKGLIENSGLLFQGFVAFQVLAGSFTFFSTLAADAVKATVRLDNLKTAMAFAAGSSVAAAEELKYVRDQADALGVPLRAAEKGFTSLEAATRGTAIEGQATRDIFLGVQQATTVLGLSSEESGRTLNALVQIAGKGTVQMEELRGQLEPLPGAFSLAARSMGVTESELNKLVDTGSLNSTEFLPKFARQLQIEYGGEAQSASGNIQSNLFRLQGAAQKTQENLGATLQPAANAGIQAATGGLNFVAAKGTALTAESQKIAFILERVGVFIGKIFTELEKIPGIGKVVEASFSAIFGVTVLLASFVSVSLIGKLLALPAVASVISVAFSVLGQALKAAFAALPKALAEFALISGAVESIRTIFSLFLPSDLGNQFKGFADQAEKQLERISTAAKKTKKDVNDAAPPEELPSEGFDLTLGVGDLLGFGAYKTDDLLKASNKQSRDKLEELKVSNPAEYERVKDTDAFKPATTVADIKFQKDAEQGDRFNDAANKLTGEVLSNILPDGSSISGRLRKSQGLDLEITALQNRNSVLKASANPDKNQIKANDEQLKALTGEREENNRPITEVQSAITGLRNSSKASIAAIDAKNYPPEKAAELKRPFEASLQNLDKAEAQMNRFTQSFKTSASVGRELSATFLEIANKIEDAKVASENLFNQNSSKINRAERSDAEKNPLGSTESATKRAIEERDRLKRDFDDAQTGVDSQESQLSSPGAKAAFAGIPIGTTGRTINTESTLKEIETAITEVGDKDANKKSLLEQLKAYRTAKNKLSGQEKDLTQADLTVDKAKQTESLAKLDRNKAIADSNLKLKDTKAFIPLRQKQKNKSIEAEDVAVSEAQLGLDSTNASISNTEAQLEALKNDKNIKAEERDKRERDLVNSLSDLKLRKADQELALQEAVNRKVLEGLELANRRAAAAIQLSATNQTTGTKKRLLAAGLSDRAEKVAGIEQLAVDESATQQRNALIQKEIADYKKLAADKRITAKELTEKLLGLNQELADNNGKLVDLQISKQKALQALFNLDVDYKVAADNRSTQAIVRNLQKQKNAAEQVLKSLDISRKLAQSKGDLQSAISAYNQTIAQGQVDQASKNLDVFTKASEEKDPNKRKGYQQIAQALGVAPTGNKAQQKEALLDAKEAAERNLADIKSRALETEYALKAKLLELDLKRDKLQAQQAVREAQIAELGAKKEVRKAEGELKKAINDGDPEKIAEAQSSLDDAKQGLDLAQQNTAGAREGLAATDQLAADSRAKLGVEQNTAFAQNGQERQNLSLSQATERVEAGIKSDRVLNGTGLGGFGAVSGFGANGLSLTPVGGANNDDRGLRDTRTAFSPRIDTSLAIAPVTPSISDVGITASSGGKVESFNSDLINLIGAKLDMLNANIERLANTPRALSFQTANPVADYASYQNGQTGNMLRG